jgi:hypothetical protein
VRTHFIYDDKIKIKMAVQQITAQPVIEAGRDPDPFRTRKSNLLSLLCTDLRERLEDGSAGIFW